MKVRGHTNFEINKVYDGYVLNYCTFGTLKVNRQQPRSARLRPIQKIPTPIKLLISPLPEMINQICKKYSLENSQD